MARSIEISTAVYAAIWAARRDGEESEDDILARVLGVHAKEPKTGGGHSSRTKVRWVDDIVEALRTLGGAGTYPEIYEAVRSRRLQAGRSIPRSFEEVVRKEIETHAGKSRAFAQREDLFVAPRGLGAGYWALKEP